MMSLQSQVGVRVGGVEDVLVRFGKCCEPLPGERILGFITRGRGVTVHAVDCPRVLDSDPQRRVEVVWEKDADAPRAVSLEVVCIDAPGLLAAMSKAISSTGVNISRAQVRNAEDGKATDTFEVVVNSVDQLNRVVRSLSKVRGVMKVTRIRT
jgi:GTP pyrophosphokinase